jgi:signal peptidase II
MLAGRGAVSVEETTVPRTVASATGRTARRRYAIMLSAAAVVLAVDHLTKWLVASRIVLGGQVPAQPEIVNIHYIQNSGAAFGIGPQLTYVYLGVAVVVAVYIVLFGPRMGSGLLGLLALGCILGGAVSNGVDRLVLGHVTDFIDFHFWPVFNCADMAIVGGMLVVVFRVGLGREDRRDSAPRP